MSIEVKATKLGETSYYPHLLISYELTPNREPVLILASEGTLTGKLYGTVLIGGGQFSQGDYRKTWRKDKFTSYSGEVTISSGKSSDSK